MQGLQGLGKIEAVPMGCQLIKPRIAIDTKQSLKQKATIVACDDLADPLCEDVHSGVASPWSLCIV